MSEEEEETVDLEDYGYSTPGQPVAMIFELKVDEHTWEVTISRMPVELIKQKYGEKARGFVPLYSEKDFEYGIEGDSL